MYAAILSMSMLVANSFGNLTGALDEPLDSELFCGRVAGFALSVAQGNGDADLAEAASLIQEAVELRTRRRLVVAAIDDDAFADAAQFRAINVAMEYSTTHSREMLADVLVSCARGL